MYSESFSLTPKPQAFHRIWNWNHLMPCTIICIILYLPFPQRRVGWRRKHCTSNYLLMSAFFTVAARCGESNLHETLILLTSQNMEFSPLSEVGSHLIIFIRKGDVVGGAERWGLCRHSRNVHQPWCAQIKPWVGRERQNRIVLQAFRCVHRHLRSFPPMTLRMH